MANGTALKKAIEVAKAIKDKRAEAPKCQARSRKKGGKPCGRVISARNIEKGFAHCGNMNCSWEISMDDTDHLSEIVQQLDDQINSNYHEVKGKRKSNK